MKKTIKVQFTDWLKEQKLTSGAIYSNFILETLKKYYDVKISENPDFVFFNILGRGYDYSKYHCIRVFCCFEETVPNFNVCDYAITICKGFEYNDRVFSDAVIVMSEQHKKNHNLALEKHLFTKEDLAQKKCFCAYVQSSVLPTNYQRQQFFKKLSEYKRIDAGGKHLNNIGWLVEDKMAFQIEHKFSIAFHNAQNYTLQDRPTDAFAAKTIPIFWGNPNADKIFNEGAYINCHNFDSFDDVIERIKEIDADDDLYLKMMQTPAFKSPERAEDIQLRFEKFLVNIIENGTKCRSGGLHNLREEQSVVLGKKLLYKRIARREKTALLLSKIFKPFTKTRFGFFIKRILLKEYYN